MIYLILLVHWIADFIFQTRQMANNKSTSWKWLSIHVGAYTCFLLPFGIKFAAINGLSHLIVDFFTSRTTSYLWKKQDVHKFFVVIGFDQLLHTVILIASMRFLAWSL